MFRITAGNLADASIDIPHCSLARWFSTLFDAENSLVALEINDPSEEYVFTDYTDANYNQLVRGTRVQSQDVAWIYRNRETGHMIRTRGELRAIMTPDFVEGVLKIEQLQVFYQSAEEYVPKQAQDSAGVSVSPGGEDRVEQVAGFDGMVRRRNIKIADMPPPLGPYGVSEQVLRFLEVSTLGVSIGAVLMSFSSPRLCSPCGFSWTAILRKSRSVHEVSQTSAMPAYH